MATLPVQKVAQCASFGVFALIGVVLTGPAPIAGASVLASAHVVSVDDPNVDPDPLIQNPPEIQAPSNPNQKTLGPQRHRSHHRAPTST